MSASPLPGELAYLASPLDHYGYAAVGLLLLLENIGAPVVPGEAMLIAAAVYAGAGRLNIVAVGVLAVIASTVGSCIGYLIGRLGGRALVVRFGRYVFLTAARLEKAERFFTRHGAVVITFARFLEGLRQANGIIAGITEMPWWRFLAFNSLGAVLWVGTWASLGYLAGDHIGTIYSYITRYLLYLLAAIGPVVIAAAVRHVLRRRHRPGAPGPARR